MVGGGKGQPLLTEQFQLIHVKGLRETQKSPLGKHHRNNY